MTTSSSALEAGLERAHWHAVDLWRATLAVGGDFSRRDVESFLDGKLGFTAIPRVIERTMNAHQPEDVSSLAVVRRVDAWGREYAREMSRELELTF